MKRETYHGDKSRRGRWVIAGLTVIFWAPVVIPDKQISQYGWMECGANYWTRWLCHGWPGTGTKQWYQDMFGKRARSRQSKFFLETQSPFLLLPSLIFPPLQSATIERIWSCRFTLMFWPSGQKCTPASCQWVHSIRADCLSVRLLSALNMCLFKCPIMSNLKQHYQWGLGVSTSS